MGHNVGKVAEIAVKKGDRKKAVETRSDEQILLDIRKNLANRLAVTADDQRFLMLRYDAVNTLMAQNTTIIQLGIQALEEKEKEQKQLVFMLEAANEALETTRRDRDNFAHQLVASQAEIAKLNEQIEQFRSVYEVENRNMSVKVERVIEEGAGQNA